MSSPNFIPAEQFCTHHQVEYSFIRLLHDNGLVEINSIDNTEFLSEECLPDVERMVRLHYDLEINLEGIEAISHLLKKIDQMQHEMNDLRNRLRFYE